MSVLTLAQEITTTMKPGVFLVCRLPMYRSDHLREAPHDRVVTIETNQKTFDPLGRHWKLNLELIGESISKQAQSIINQRITSQVLRRCDQRRLDNRRSISLLRMCLTSPTIDIQG
jgi:hypothetical protein